MAARKLSACPPATGPIQRLPVTVRLQLFAPFTPFTFHLSHLSHIPPLHISPVTQCPQIGNLTDFGTIYGPRPFNGSSLTLDDHGNGNGNVTSNWPPLQVNVQGRRVGSRARFACLPGFSIVGANELICMDSGQWSSHLPTCEGS